MRRYDDAVYEAFRQKSRAYYYANREKVLQKRKEHREMHHEEYLEKERQYRSKYRDKIRRYNAEMNKRNREMYAEEQSAIKRLRKQAMLTQNELGELCGVRGATICRWERGMSRAKYELLFPVLLGLKEAILHDGSSTD